jgi:hypothetical protein
LVVPLTLCPIPTNFTRETESHKLKKEEEEEEEEE